MNVTGFVTFALLTAFGIVVARLISVYLKRTLADRIPKNELNVMLRVINFAVVSVFVLTALPFVGVNPTGLIAAGGFAGLVVGFASRSVVANLVSGIFLMIERPIRIGDQVAIGDVAGFVEDVQILSTIIRTYDGLFVRIPNERVFTSNITNLTANPVRRFEYVVGISYSDDAERAVEVIRRVVEEHPFALKEPEPQIFVDELGESSVNIVVRVWSPSAVWYEVKTELLWKIKVELEKAGIEIPFPQRVVWLRRDRDELGKDVPAREDRGNNDQDSRGGGER